MQYVYPIVLPSKSSLDHEMTTKQKQIYDDMYSILKDPFVSSNKKVNSTLRHKIKSVGSAVYNLDQASHVKLNKYEMLAIADFVKEIYQKDYDVTLEEIFKYKEGKESTFDHQTYFCCVSKCIITLRPK